MELGFSKDGKLETFKDSDEFHVQIFLLSLLAVHNMKIYAIFLFPFNSEEILCNK